MYPIMICISGSVVKCLPANARVTGDVGLIPRSGRLPGVGNGNPRQYSCLKNPSNRGVWWATVQGVSKSQTQLSDYMHAHTHTHTHTHIILLVLFFWRILINNLPTGIHLFP